MHPARVLFWCALMFLIIVAFATRHSTREEFAEKRDQSRIAREARYRPVFAVRDWFLASLDRVIPPPINALVGGVLLGSRSQLPREITEDFRRTGLSHVMAISGYNVSIITVMLMNILAPLVARRRAFWAIIGLVAFFTILTGLQPSVIRAGIMGLFVLFAQYVGRVPTPLHALTIAAALMVAFNPLILRFDIGFQLSVMATLGILTLAPKLEKKLWETASVTISAQLFVLPLILYYFKTFSIIALPANLVILPMIPWLMFLGFFAGLLGWIPIIGEVAGFLAWTLGKIILVVVHWFAIIPWASMYL